MVRRIRMIRRRMMIRLVFFFCYLVPYALRRLRVVHRAPGRLFSMVFCLCTAVQIRMERGLFVPS
jgi:hypothetical protein